MLIDKPATNFYLASFNSFCIKAAGALALFFVTFWVAKEIPTDEAGLFFLSITTLTIIATISRLGLENTLVKFIASYDATNRPDLLAGTYHLALRWIILASVTMAFLTLGFSTTIAGKLFNNPLMAPMLCIIALALPALNIMTANAQSLQGLKRISWSTIALSLAWASIFLLCLFIFPPNNSVETLTLYCFSIIAASIISYWLWRAAKPNPPITTTPPTPEIINSAYPLWWVQLISLINVWLPPLLLGIWHSPDNVALFTVALRFAMLISFILIAVNAVIAPRFAELYAQGKLTELSSLAKRTALLLSLCATPLFLIIVFSARFLLSFMGQEYIAAAPTLQLLAVSELITAILGPVGFLLIMSSNERLLRNNLFIGGSITIITSIIFIPQFGSLGAALAMLAGISMTNGLSAYTVYRRLGFWALPNLLKNHHAH